MDNLKIKQPQDGTKINVHEKWEIEYWTKKLGVSEQELKNAVSAVGVSVTKVKEYLGNHTKKSAAEILYGKQ